MKTKFDEWYKKMYSVGPYNSDTYFASEAAWNACKEEIWDDIEKLSTKKKLNIMDIAVIIEKI